MTYTERDFTQIKANLNSIITLLNLVEETISCNIYKHKAFIDNTITDVKKQLAYLIKLVHDDIFINSDMNYQEYLFISSKANIEAMSEMYKELNSNIFSLRHDKKKKLEYSADSIDKILDEMNDCVCKCIKEMDENKE